MNELLNPSIEELNKTHKITPLTGAFIDIIFTRLVEVNKVDLSKLQLQLLSANENHIIYLLNNTCFLSLSDMKNTGNLPDCIIANVRINGRKHLTYYLPNELDKLCHLLSTIV